LGQKKIKVIKSILIPTSLLLFIAFIVAGYLIFKWNIAPVDKNMILSILSFCFILSACGLLFSFKYLKNHNYLIFGFTVSILILFILGLNSYLLNYYKYSHKDLRDFAIIAKENKAKEIISFGMYRPSLQYYSRLPVDFETRNVQVEKIRNLYSVNESKKVFIVGHVEDIQNHKKLFKKVKLLYVRKKYFFGEIVRTCAK